MAEVIASAVALPDTDDLVEYSTSIGLKRRQSEALGDDESSSSSSKRQRTSPGKTSPRSRSKGAEAEREDVISSVARARSITPIESKQGDDVKPETPPQDSRDGRRKSAAVHAPDEKQRSKRLFGALLGNLNRPSDRQSKRRAEIEQRKKAELQKQDDERLEDRQRRLERLDIQRKNEQLQVDERVMHIRHKNLLSNANFLHTRTEPQLYYRPWDLLPEEEDLIERQLKEAQAQVNAELMEWRQRPGIDEEPRDDKHSGNTTHEDASKHVEPLESDVNKDEEMIAENTNAQSEAEATANAAELHETAEVPNSVPSSPQPANSAVDEDEFKQLGKSEEGGEQAKEQQTIEDEKDKKDETIEVELPETSATENTNAPTNSDACVKNDKDELDDDGDHVVEGDEDDVIY